MPVDDGIHVHLAGVDELRRALKGVPEKLRKRGIRHALRKAGRVISGEAKRLAPVLKGTAKRRQRGTVRKAIAVRSSKFARRLGNEGVFINVRPLRGKRQLKLGKAGAKNPNDPFYWQFLEFGTKKMRARPFLRPAARRKSQEAINTFMRSVKPYIDKLNRRT